MTNPRCKIAHYTNDIILVKQGSGTPVSWNTIHIPDLNYFLISFGSFLVKY